MKLESPIDDYIAEMDRETAQRAEPLARELIKSLNNFFRDHESDDPGDAIYIAREAVTALLVYVICLWRDKCSRHDDAESVCHRILDLVDERIKAH